MKSMKKFIAAFAIALAAINSGSAFGQASTGGGGGGSAITANATSLTAGQTLTWDNSYAANATAGAFTLTLPATPTDGKVHFIYVQASGTGSNLVTLALGPNTWNGPIPPLTLGSGQLFCVQTNGTNIVQSCGNYANALNRSWIDVSMQAGSTSTNIATNDHFRYDTVHSSGGGDITLDTATAYSNLSGAASIGRFTLKAGRTYAGDCDIGDVNFSGAQNSWVAYAWANADTGTAINTGNQAFVNNTGQNGTTNLTFGSSASGRSLATFTFTPSVDTKVECRITGNATFTGYNGGLNTLKARARIQTIGGQAPVLGQSVDTGFVRTNAGVTSSIPTNTQTVIFDTYVSGNIPYNTATGVWTLTAGKTYRLIHNIRVSGMGATSWANYTWVDAVSNVPLVPNMASRSQQVTGTFTNDVSPAYEILYTPTTNQTVKVIQNISQGAAFVWNDVGSYASITQIGSSGITSGIAFPCQVADFLATSLPAGFVALNGQLVSSLTPTQQAVATSTCGVGANLPDARDRVVAGRNAQAVGSVAGANSVTLAQNQLPNTTLGLSSVTSTQGGSVNTDSSSAGASGFGMFEGGGTVSGYPATGSTTSINGGVTQQPINIQPATIYFTKAIYLGL